VKGLGVRRPWRRRGLGGALLAHTFAALAARGRLRVELGVDAEGETQPLRSYERAGMHVTFTYELYAKPLAG
jgi:ribosomal protein S18 acetylase RimI-like enzyme